MESRGETEPDVGVSENGDYDKNRREMTEIDSKMSIIFLPSF